jgi:hypothetical protein
MRGDLPLVVSVGDRPCEVHSSYSWTAGGMVLTLSTVVPEPGLAIELISTYVGHPQTATIVTHLFLGPVGQKAAVHAVEQEREQLNPIERPRECVYEHAHQLMESLAAAGQPASVQLDEHAFAELERVE